jgi:GAF domain-containing protein
MSDAETILKDVDALIKDRTRRHDWLKAIFVLLQKERPHYNWVGFYYLSGGELVLGPFVGAPSPHKRIPLDKGICGAAVRERRTVNVPDVTADPRYLACSVETKSEIVVPIEHNGEVVGEIDVDSHQPAAFGPADQSLLEGVASRLAPILGQATTHY